MARLNARWSRFWNDARFYKRFWQAYPITGTGAGATLTDTVSLISGSATGAANTAGQTLTANGATLAVTTSLIAGAASVSTAAETLTLTTSLIAGQVNVSADGAALAVTTSVVEGHASVSTAADTLTVTASLIAGQANVTADGAALELDVSLIDGQANVTADGALLELDLALVDGVADISADGATLQVDLTLIAGSAVDIESGLAVGDTVAVGISVIPGKAEGGFVRVAGGMPYGPSIPQRRPPVSAIAHGATITLLTFALPGTAFGENIAEVREVPAPPLAAPLQVTYETATAAGSAVVRQIMLEAGRATGDAIAFGQLVEGRRDWGQYDNDVLALVLA
jgi:hypothetical protein